MKRLSQLLPLSPGSFHIPRPVTPVVVISSDEEPIKPNSTPRGALPCSLHPDSLHSDTSDDVMSNTAAISASPQSPADSGLATETVTDLPGPSNLNTTNFLPNDIAHTAESSPVQPVNMRFPQTKFGNSCRSFNATWYNSYK